MTLTDKFLNIDAFKYLAAQSSENTHFIKAPLVHATMVSSKLIGFRTMFSAMHHFSKETGSSIQKNAVKAKTGTGIFDGGDKNVLFILLMIATDCIGFLLLEPFIRPFSWGRIFSLTSSR